MDVILQFYVVRYVDDPSSKKVLNVAVIAFDGFRAQYQGMGIVGKTVDPVFFQSIAKKTFEAEWVYREWAYWLEGFSRIRKIEEFKEAVDCLKSNNAGFLIDTEGESLKIGEIEESTFLQRLPDCSDAMQKLFKQYIRIPKKSPEIVFKNQTEKLLKKAEFYSDKSTFIEGAESEKSSFFEGAEVEMISEDESDLVKLEFSHLVSGENPIGFSTMMLQGVKPEVLSLQADSIIENFKNAKRTGYLQSDRCVLLCGPIQKKHSELIKRFFGVAEVVDVFDLSIGSKLREMV